MPSSSPSVSLVPSLVPSESAVPSAAPSCVLPSLTVVTNNTQVPIPDEDPIGASVTLNVANEIDECVIEGVVITLGIGHTFVGDLELTLTSPGNAGTAILINRQGGRPNLVRTNPITFDDASLRDPSTISANAVSGIIQAGTFFSQGDGAGNNKLSSLVGGSPLGDWVFKVVDNVGADVGTIGDVTLRVTSKCPCELEPSLSPSISLNPTTSASVSCLTLTMFLCTVHLLVSHNTQLSFPLSFYSQV